MAASAAEPARTERDSDWAGRLMHLLEQLKDDGYRIGVDQHVLVRDLLLVLASRGSLPAEVGSLESYLAPLLCKSADERARFRRHFLSWLGRYAPDTRPSALRVAAGGGAGDPIAVGSSLQSIWRRVGRWLGSLIGLLALAVVGGWLALWLLPQPAELDALSVPVPSVRPQTSGRSAPVLQAAKPSVLQSLSARPATYTVAQIEPLPVLATIGLCGVLLVALIAPVFVMRRRFDTLPAELRQLSAGPAPEQLTGWLRSVLRLDRSSVAMLARHRPGERLTLDPDRTVAATARRAGLVELRYRAVKERPGHLLLIDSGHPDDQQLGWYQHWVDELRSNGLEPHVFHFSVDPRTCWEPGARTTVSLARLADSHRGDRLLIFSDGSGLFDPLSGKVPEWVRERELMNWPERIVLTPVEPELWGRRESALGKAGIVVLPASARGLAAMVQWLSTRAARLVARPGAARRFPPSLEDGGGVFCEPNPPDAEQLDELVQELRAYLGANGFVWLASCAVYPLLRWELTLALGRALLGEQEPALHLQRLFQLPWFRRGAMPEWLRLRLLAELGSRREQDARRAAESLLEPAAGGRPRAGLPVAPEQASSRGKRGGPHGDFVSVGFLGGLSGRQLALRAPAHWRRSLQPAAAEAGPLARAAIALRAWGARLLYRGGLPAWGVSPIVAVIIAACLSAATLTGIWGLGQREIQDTLPNWLRNALYKERENPLQFRVGATALAVAFSPDGTLLASAGGDKVFLWDAAEGNAVQGARHAQGAWQHGYERRLQSQRQDPRLGKLG